MQDETIGCLMARILPGDVSVGVRGQRLFAADKPAAFTLRLPFGQCCF
jgi:hypothetical protein